MGIAKKVRIGDLLIQEGLISKAQLDEVLAVQKERGGKIGDLVIEMKLVKENEFLQALANQLKVPFVDIEHLQLDHAVVRKLPERFARRFRTIILEEHDDKYIIGMADPTDLNAYDEVHNILKKTLDIAVVKESDLVRVMDQVYRRTEDIVSFAAELKSELQQDETALAFGAEGELTEENAPVAKLLESIFEDAVQVHASDIHIEPDEHSVRIRQRVDGILQEEIIQGREIAAALVLRVKLLSQLNISEKRLPQDGRFNIKIRGRSIDVRVSTMPIQHGESVVMRLLDQSQGILHMEQLGMEAEILERLRFHIHRPMGLVLVTGPTGSGKTTTLYACLSELNKETKKIITIEDPVEYRIPRINQVQIKPKIDLSFARVLRSSLRQDPDIVMVGEMRDEETARIGLRAAMTGHLVLSTLHTNDSISSAIRLLDMGAEGFLVAGSLRCVMAQRLVRRVCETCRAPHTPTVNEKSWLESMVGEVNKNWQFYMGKGCTQCSHSGYVGRVGVHELLEITPTLADALRENDTVKFTHLAVKQKGFVPLPMGALHHAIEGRSTLEEVFRIAGEIEDVRRHAEEAQETLDVSGIRI